jgi:hypothetical protein
MVWKPKEKQLSKEEALALARTELGPFWFGSTPLIAGARHGNTTGVYPLNPSFEEKSWLIFFFNPTEEHGISFLYHLRELHRRYSTNDIGALGLIPPTYAFLRDPRAMELFIKRHQISFPLAIDNDGLLSEAFEIKQAPAVILLSKHQQIFRKLGLEWMHGLEESLQDFLRVNDPGLALLRLYKRREPYKRESHIIEFGKKSKYPFPKPGFVMLENGYGAAKFEPSPTIPGPGGFSISGNWIQDADRIITSDNKAEIIINSPAPDFALVAQSVAKTLETAKIILEVDDAPSFESFGHEDMAFDDDGLSVCRIDSPRLYHLLRELPAGKRKITLRFPMAHIVPIALYGFRFIAPDMKTELATD